MKRTVALMGVMLCLVAGAAHADSVKGRMAAGGYLGYAFGVGSYFDDIEFDDYKISPGAGFGFGGHFHYGVSETIMIGGEIYMQSYGFDAEGSVGGFTYSGSESETNVNFLASGLYAMSNDEKKAFFLTGGLGMYDAGDTQIGIFGGVLHRWMVSETVGIYVMPRIHIVFADDMFELIQICAGVQIPFGSDGTMSR